MAAALPVSGSKMLNCSQVPGLLLLILPLLLLPTGGCSDPETKENEHLRATVSSIHDEAMAELDQIYEFSTRLKTLRGACDQVADQQIEENISALQAADRAMFDWMHQYQLLFVDQDISKDNDYRRQQLQKITEVGQLAGQAISAAEQTIAACGNGQQRQ